MLDPKPLWNWVNERHATFLRKSIREGAEAGTLSRWSNGYLDRVSDPLRHGATSYLTRDPILSQYRFCNVFRELDRVTEWIRYNIRRPYADHPDLWLMLAIARTINWPETLQYLMNRHAVRCDYNAWPNGQETEGLSHFAFSPKALGEALDHWSQLGEKVYTRAYMIRAESNPNAEWYNWTKQQYIAQIVIGRLWEDRQYWSHVLADGDLDAGTGVVTPTTMESVWKAFQHPRYIGWGPFMAYQVVVDMRHTRYLRDAPDINTWAALGPGSRRGLNRLAGRSVDYPLKQDQGLEEMRRIWEDQDSWRAPWVPRIELSDIQNCLCETDKYLRAASGEGRPRSRYVPGRGW